MIPFVQDFFCSDNEDYDEVTLCLVLKGFLGTYRSQGLSPANLLDCVLQAYQLDKCEEVDKRFSSLMCEWLMTYWEDDFRLNPELVERLLVYMNSNVPVDQRNEIKLALVKGAKKGLRAQRALIRRQKTLDRSPLLNVEDHKKRILWESGEEVAISLTTSTVR